MWPIKWGEHRRKALLVLPGGGYFNVCSDREGEPIAQAFLPHGYNAFVLHYTVAHTADDEQVHIGNTLAMSQAYAEAGVPFETHIYPFGPHGMALANEVTDLGQAYYNDAAFAQWVSHAALWAQRFCK